MDDDRPLGTQVRGFYREFVQEAHPDLVDSWPLISGADSTITALPNGWVVLAMTHTGRGGITMESGASDLSPGLFRGVELEESNIERIRSIISHHFGLTARDGVVIGRDHRRIPNYEFTRLLHQHEFVIGIAPMKIFLSHKGADKPKVREFKQTLELLGFQPWLDEDAMTAGDNLDRAILKGMQDSCAAVFFITQNFVDANWLGNEIEYARTEQRSRGDRFRIITLVFEGSTSPTVPDLLRNFLWKEPRNDLEALRDILRSLPIKVGEVRFK